jgi:hypothetical protein
MKPIAAYLSVVLLSSILSIPSSLAVESTTAPSRAIGRFAENGKIDRVDIKEGVIVVDDRLYKLSPTVRVYMSSGSTASPGMLRNDMRIGFNVSGQDSRVVAEVLIILSK